MERIDTENWALALDSLLAKVHQHGGYDFRDYRHGTITRRLDRRLHAAGARTYPEYMQFLDTHPEEYEKLTDDLTIKVSNFFRSPYSCQKVTEMVLPELFRCKVSGGEQNVRLWSTACARGEEPYSIAILLAEFLGKQHNFDISIYATDISQRALSEAQAGLYSPRDVEGLSPALLHNYFDWHSQGYQVKADIRQLVNFSHFDLTSTARPPFMNLDCIFCCNVLIYFQRHLQERVLNMLYESLATPGYLILGEAETLTSNLCDRLECLDSKARIYKKVTG